MNPRPLNDRKLECIACGDGFVFTAGEQELHLVRGIAQEPERCPICTRGKTLSPALSRAAKRND